MKFLLIFYELYIIIIIELFYTVVGFESDIINEGEAKNYAS